MNKKILLVPILLFLCIGTAFSSISDYFFNKSQIDKIIQNLEEELFCEHLIEIFIENKEKSDKEIIDLLIEATSEKKIAEITKVLRTRRAVLLNDIFDLKIRKIVDYKSFITAGLAAISASAALFAKYTYHAGWYGYVRPQGNIPAGYQYYDNFKVLYEWNIKDLDKMNNDIDSTQRWLDIWTGILFTPNDVDDPLVTQAERNEMLEMNEETNKTIQKDKDYLVKYQQEITKIKQSLQEQYDYIKKPIILSIISLLAIPLVSLKNYKKINAEIAEKNNEITQINALLTLCRKHKTTLFSQ